MKVILGEQAKRRRTGGGDKEKERDAVPPVEGAGVGREMGEMKKGGGGGKEGKKSLASLAKKFAKR
jgi:hypothetical protein